MPWARRLVVAVRGAGLLSHRAACRPLSSAASEGDGATAAVVLEVHDETPVAKRVRLAPQERGFGFAAGQWVDVFIDAPSVGGIVGGFTICSTPQQLREEGWFDLVVKRAAWPPASWVHREAAPGARVRVRAGGDFGLRAADEGRPLLAVAGGIGITPIHAVLAEAVPAGTLGDALLLYSARRSDGHALSSSLAAIAQGSEGRLQCVLHHTGTGGGGGGRGGGAVAADGVAHRDGRIGVGDLEGALRALAGHRQPLALVCGPPGFTDATVHRLEGLGLTEGEDIRFERWW